MREIGTPVLATALFGPAGTVAAKVAVGAWSVAMAKEQLSTDGQVATLDELALIGVERYAATIKREAGSVAALVAATSVPPSPQGSMTDLTGLELGIEHQATQTFDVKRAVVRVTVRNPGTTPVTYRLIATYSTPFDVPFGSAPPVYTALDGFRRSSDQVLPGSDMLSALTVQPGQHASIDLALKDAGTNLDLEPPAGATITIALVAITADTTKIPGSVLLQTAKIAYDGQSLSHHVALATL